MAFDIPSVTRDFWTAETAARAGGDKPVQVFTDEDIAWVEETWGGRVPDDYRAFMTTHGAVSLDGPAVPSWLMVAYRDGERTSWEQARVLEFLTTEQMRKHRAWLFEDPDDPVFPPGYFPVAQNGLMSFFVMQVGVEASKVFFWEESDDPWGEGENTKLADAADGLADLFAKLKTG